MESEKETVQEIREKLIKIETLLEGTMNSFNDKLKVLDNRIEDLENNQKWFICAILGSVITLIFSLVK